MKIFHFNLVNFYFLNYIRGMCAQKNTIFLNIEMIWTSRNFKKVNLIFHII